MEIPVYLFTGFLEAGKTKLLQETLEDKRFNAGERTLVLLCEEGENELDPTTFASPNVIQKVIDSPDDLTPDKLSALQKRAGAERVMVEYNGMWTLDRLYGSLPEGWFICQEVMAADATTFALYNANMRQLMVDKLQSCELVIFNRLDPTEDRVPYHRVVRGVSRRAGIIYESRDGSIQYDEMEDPLPFDINAPVIEIEDRDYALWYRDMTEDVQKYVGKTVRFKGIVARDPSLGDTSFAVGRHVMTCCEADIAYHGLVALTEKAARSFMPDSRDWVILTAKILYQHCKLYKGKGPVLEVSSLERATKPEQEVATFY